MMAAAARTPHGRLGDLWGGLAAMLVALPAAIGFGVLVYTSIGPEYAAAGAVAGALGTGVLGVVASPIGRNGGFITAPCAPAAAVLAGLAASLSAGLVPAAGVPALLALTGLLAGALQVAWGALGFGRLIKYIPYQVVSGFLTGVALIIGVAQVPRLLGVAPGDGVVDALLHPGTWSPVSLAVGAATIAVTVLAPRVTTRVPAAILGLGAGLVTYGLCAAALPELRTLEGNALVVGPIPGGLGAITGVADHLRALASVGRDDLTLVAASALTLSVLMSIDTLKTGVVLDALTMRRHHSDRELVGQGIGNVASALVGGMAGAGTMGPTLVNVSSGGRSPVSGVVAGALALLAFLALGSLVAWVPIGALAGLLLVVAWRMIDRQAFDLLRHRETRLDFVVIAAVVVVALAVGLIQASLVGVGLAILLFLRDQARTSVIVRYEDLTTARSKTRRTKKARRFLEKHGDAALLVELQGNLFFGTTDQLVTELEADLATRRYILLDLRRVRSVDYTAGQMLRIMAERLEARGGRLLLSGMPSSMPTRPDIARYLRKLGLVGGEDGIPVFDSRNDALSWMERKLLGPEGLLRQKRKRPLELEEMELFRELDEGALAALRAAVQPREVKAGELLFDKGDAGDEMFLVRNGALDVLWPLPGGQEHHVATIARDDYLGEMAFLDRGLRSARVRARRDASVFALSRARFDEVAHGDPVAAAQVFARLALVVTQRLRATNAALLAHEVR